MLSEKKINEIIFQMNKKNIKNKYQKYILEYVELNDELFKSIDIEELIKRVVENFGGVSLNLTSFIYKDFGQYVPTSGKILLSPNLYFGSNRKYKKSVFFHELDHCACSSIKVKQSYYDYKNKIKKKNKLYKIIPDFLLKELFLKIHYDGPISGIANLETKKGYIIQKISYGTKLENYLNEGITSFKQIIYSNHLNIMFHKKKDFFYGARIGVQCLAYVIGFDNMIYLHFNNNFRKMEENYYLKTGLELKDLIIQCIIYDKKRTKKKLKQLKNYVEKVYKIVDIQ